MKIAILGISGMLGSTVYKYFKENTNYEVIGTSKDDKFINDKDIFRFNALEFIDKDYPWSTDNFYGVDYIINCIGIIKPAIKNQNDIYNAILINSIFPRKLCNCNKNVINISTDCTFSGNKGRYIESSPHDAQDEYGKTKSLGEDTENSMVLRTSIIGEEINNHYSLISWCKSQKNKEVNGFINHFWNGITTLQYAKCCHSIIKDNLYNHGLYHIFSDQHSKYEMLNMFNNKWDLNMKINAVKAAYDCDRTLNTIKDLNSKLNIPILKKQLEEI